MVDPRPRPSLASRTADHRADGSGPRRSRANEALPDDATQEELALAMAKAVARRAVLDWEGVGDDAGDAVPVSPEGIDALLEIWPVFEAFQTQYVAKGLILDAEKRLRALQKYG